MSDASTTWSYTIEDTSLFYSYSPFTYGEAVGVPGEGWQLIYDNHPTVHGTTGEGNSISVANAKDSSFAFSFYGDGVSLLGAYNATYSITVDGSEATSLADYPDALVNGTIWEDKSLSLGTHSIEVKVTSDEADRMLLFDKGVIYNSASNDLVDTHPTIIETKEIVVGGSDHWDRVRDPRFAPDADDYVYLRSDDQGAFATFNFTGTRTLAVYSTLNFNHGQTRILINDKELEFNRTKEWLIPRTVTLWQDNLDEDETYVVSFLNLDQRRITMSTVELHGSKPQKNIVAADSSASASIASHTGSLSPSSTSDSSPTGGSSDTLESHKSNAGTIAGAVVGAVAGVAIVAALLFFFLRRRRQQKNYAERPPIPIDEGITPVPFPYSDDPNNNHRDNASSSADVSTRKGAFVHNTGFPEMSQAALAPNRQHSEHGGPHSSSSRSEMSAPQSSAGGSNHNYDHEAIAQRAMELLAARIDPPGRSADADVPPMYSDSMRG